MGLIWFALNREKRTEQRADRRFARFFFSGEA